MHSTASALERMRADRMQPQWFRLSRGVAGNAADWGGAQSQRSLASLIARLLARNALRAMAEQRGSYARGHLSFSIALPGNVAPHRALSRSSSVCGRCRKSGENLPAVQRSGAS